LAFSAAFYSSKIRSASKAAFYYSTFILSASTLASSASASSFLALSAAAYEAIFSYSNFSCALLVVLTDLFVLKVSLYSFSALILAYSALLYSS